MLIYGRKKKSNTIRAGNSALTVVINISMKDYLLITTFNKAGYQTYGQKMLEAFLQNWPESQKILVYIESVNVDDNIKNNPRVIIRDLNEVQALTLFKARHTNNPKAHGFWPAGQTIKNFQFDAVRFSHKVFALYDATKNLPFDAGSLVWLDADTMTHRSVPTDFLERVAPRSYTDASGQRQKYGICYLGRTKQHSECGFVSYNLRHPSMPAFWETFADMYRTDALLDLPEWHDSYVFDYVRQKYETKGMVNHNITPGYHSGHPFINSLLGEYLDHMKGARKKHGRSRKYERHIKSQDESEWWK